MKKTLLFFLITALLLLLCSCHRTQTGSEDRQDTPASTPIAITNTEDAFTLVDSGTGPLQDEEQPTRVSHLEVCYFALPEDGTITAKVLRGDCLIAAAQTQSGMKLYQMSFQQETRELALPDGANYIYALRSDEEGLWMLYGALPHASRDYQGNVVIQDHPSGDLYLAHLNRDMEPDTTLNLSSGTLPAGERFEQLLVSGDYLYLMSAEHLYRTDWTGQVLATLSCDLTAAGRFSAMQLWQNLLFVLTEGVLPRQQNALSSYDCMTLQNKQEVALETAPLCFGSDADGSLLLGDASALSVFDPEAGLLTTEFRWDEALAEPCSCRIQKTDDGFLYDNSNETVLTALLWKEGPQTQKKILTLAVTTQDAVAENLQDLVRSYNTSQDKVQVQYTIYSNQSESYKNDLLRTKIMAGEAPDLIYFCSTGGYTAFPIEPRMACMDLSAIISTNDIVPGLLEAVKTGDHLYILPLTFAMDSFIASKEFFSSSQITLQELEQIRQETSDTWETVEAWNTPENLFGLVAPFLLGTCVDWNRLTCNFESQEVLDVLNWCKTWGRDGTGDARDEKVLLRYKQIARLDSLVGLHSLAQNWFDDDYLYVGIPGLHYSASALGITSALGVTTQCTQLELARDFLQYAFEYAGSYSVSLPASSSQLHKRMEYYLSGNATNRFGTRIRIEEDDANRFFEMLSSVSILKNANPNLMQILSDETGRFFSGQCDAKSATKIIQNRASLYFSERKLISTIE